MVRIPYEDNKFVGSSVILLVFVGCIIPISVVSMFGFSSPTIYSPPPNSPAPQGEVTLLPPPQYLTVGNGTTFDSLVNETVDPVAFSADAPVVEGDEITIFTAYPVANISINESQAISIATDFISSFEYMQGITLAPSAYLSTRTPCWIVNSQVEGGSVGVQINAVSGIVCFYMLNVDLQLAEDTDLRLYFSGSTNISREAAEVNASVFLQQYNYTLVNGSRYSNPYYKPLPPGVISEGFVNGKYIFQIYGMSDGILERNNRVMLEIEASTGAVVYFSYLWTEIPEYPEVDIVDPETVQDSAIGYLSNRGITSATLGYPYLVLDAHWFPDIGYTGSVYWQVSVEDGSIIELRISPISGEVFGSVSTVTATAATATVTDATGPVPGALASMPLGLVFILPLSSFSLGLAGYIIVRYKQTRRLREINQ
ncbi:MAG: hypothetical protein RTU63_08410 [Candidatus Thorarchaeota archaeon]